MDEAVSGDQVLTIGVPAETHLGENRVALVPDTVEQLADLGLSVVMESGAGKGASCDDEAYALAGARVESRPGAVYRQADVIAKVQPPTPSEVALMRPGAFLVSFLDPSRNHETLASLTEHGITAFSFNAVPRTTRAQSMDAMSAMSTVAGYKAVLLAADTIGRFFPLLMTAAGTLPPARVVVIGAGVAGLQALATARRLGAVTAACDARPAVAEQIKSVGAGFIDMSVDLGAAEGQGGYAREMDEEYYRRERDLIREHVANADVVIGTAQVPGARAPILIDEGMVRDMRAGSVIVDLAAEAGGNCELTVPGDAVTRYGVTILGPANVASSLAVDASRMYSHTVGAVLKYVIKDGALDLNFDDEILRAACLTRGAPATT
ncbi:MAG TPA: Re/Si-specific NAD(P)(+) transhydrogenase subunit alpha [Chloroflexota bacterium]|nr:Re/Si-specific NAD(P)(+) transhydrogenase subunit alpha [Chloroflexota bacterium]